jgi:4-alpha-glucanotransferase
MHPTCLPGPFGIGEIGPEAYRFIDFLLASGQTYWQILPLSPTDESNSPYSGLSAFAGNPLLISLDELYRSGYVSEKDMKNTPVFSDQRVEFEQVIPFKIKLLEKAYHNFKSAANNTKKEEYLQFCQSHKYWLDDFALFMTLLEKNNNKCWQDWPTGLRSKDKKEISKAKKELFASLNKHKFLQWQFYQQWFKLKLYANQHGIKIIGDIPFFIAMNSTDVWSHSDLYCFNDRLEPLLVSGVPPDYFSDTGQLWGHPIYRWDKMAEENYKWWIHRFRMMSMKADIVRIDHFRGIYDYWEVLADETTAMNGRWVNGPGADFLHAITKALGDLVIIAEDLGDFDAESRAGVDKLKKKFGYPGMKIVQFGFSNGPGDLFLPHNFSRDCVAYTGTHDNDTVRGWYEVTSTDHERHYVRKYLGTNCSDISWDLIRITWASTAHTAITTVQDLLSLGHEKRMNTPSTVNSENWSWRLLPAALNEDISKKLRELTEIFGRL